MSRIRDKDTRPEMLVRRGLHALGYRYRLHDRRLPGNPDLVFPKYKAVVEVNGCFWHLHDCHLFKWPGTRAEFWREKLERNRERDRRDYRDLLDAGWRLCVVWECALKGRTSASAAEIVQAVAGWLESDRLRLDLEGVEE